MHKPNLLFLNQSLSLFFCLWWSASTMDVSFAASVPAAAKPSTMRTASL